MRKPELVLEQLFLHEKNADTGPDTDALMETIRVSNSEVLRSYPAEDMKAAIEAKINAKKAPLKIIPQNRFAYMKIVSYAAAVCCIVLVSMVTIRTNSGTGSLSPGGITERIKGNGPRLFVYKKDGEKAVLLNSKTPVARNDVVQLSYFSGGDPFGAILSVDGNGVLTQHFPDSGDATAALATGGEVSLDFSYKLDDAPKFERFIFITGKTKISIAQYKNALSRAALTDGKGSFDILSALPDGTRVTDVLLLK